MQTCLELPEAISDVGQLHRELKIAFWPAAVNIFASLENSEETTIPRGHRGERGLRLRRRELSQCPIELKIHFN
ncbi:hypothetical protein AOLI_G00096390 [Acnodon oligacanthus]